MEMSPILDCKLRRISFLENQTKILMERFQANKFPTKEEKCELAMSFNSTVKRIANWYGYMRHKQGAKERLSQG